ncbi:MAG: hypothetical protein V4639_03235 [Pseudomonadota bacterium]
MSVSVQTPYKKYTAAAAATVFPTTFRVVLAGDLQVTVDAVVVTSGFTLSALGLSAGVDVTFTTPMVGGEVVELQRIIPKSRVNDYQQLGNFDAAVVNADIDRLWMSNQELGEEIGRAVKVPIGSTIDPDQLIADLLATQAAAEAAAADAEADKLAAQAAAAAAAASAASIALPLPATSGGTGVTSLAALRALLDIGKNYVINGSFAVAQTAIGTTDNSYTVDGWRLLLGAANAAVPTQDTADVPVGAGYALKLTVGSGNNNKFAVFCPIENTDMADLKGGVCSLRVPLKATAGLTDGAGKIRIGILQWTGTADAISANPISAWGAEGTNPTLAAGWAFANVPAAVAVTTSWADYTAENVAISASATNLAVLIWSDDKTNTQTTDILRIGGYVVLASGAVAPPKAVAKYIDELTTCQRYVRSTFPRGTVPAQNVGSTGAWCFPALTTNNKMQSAVHWDLPMFAAPTVTFYNPVAANAQVRDVTVSGDATNTAAIQSGLLGFGLSAQLAGIGADIADNCIVHFTAVARL